MRKTKSKKSKQQAQPAAVTEHEQTDTEEHDNSRSLSPICKGKVVIIYIVVILILAFNYLSTSKSFAASPVNSNQTVQSSSILREKENIRTGVMMRSISHDFDVLVMEVEHRKNESSRRFSHESSASMANTPNASNGKMDIVIGMAQDTDPKNLAVFCSSFREHSKPDAADAVLFVNIPVPDRHRDIAKQAAVQLIEFDLNNLSSSSASFAAKYHPSTLRWSLVYRFFSDAAVRARYHRVLLIDVRDSFFQGDPFSIIPTATVSAFHAFKGVEHITIKECGWNRGWVRDCFGEDVLREIGSLNIICSGVSLGTMTVVFDYLRLMDDVVMGRKEAPISQLTKFPSCERNGVDQGVHNVLVHKQLIRDLTVWSQHDSPVVNLQARRARVTGRNVHNDKNELVPVVHQYDRYPDLQKALFAEALVLIRSLHPSGGEVYVKWVNTNDPEEMWRVEVACTQYDYKMDSDIFKGTCDLKTQGGATSAASCCTVCSKTPSCVAFTFYSGTCFMKSCVKGKDHGVALATAVSGWLKGSVSLS